ncbi:MAG: long-chain-fatty-acid--CoA ligase, partial [Actinomycetota bacterium]
LYEDLLADQAEEFDWPEVDERSAAAMCYTSGTTGNPKGVVYSHRSIYLHSLGEWGANGLSDRDRLLLIVPMFHVNAWGLPYTGFMIGADLILPGPHLQAEPLTRLIAAERPTFAGAVPTVWADVLRYSESNPVDLSSLRMVICGGSAVPRALMERFQNELGVRIVQAWGMTETSPLAALAEPPRGVTGEEAWVYRSRTGRPIFDVELRIAGEDGTPLAWDGTAEGEIQVRGPWITASYYQDPAPEKFQDGWLRTGDVGTVTPDGFIQITDRSKDVIKSGGEWISSVQLEGLLASHPDVLEAAVIAVPDDRWQERPLACVVPRDGVTLNFDSLREFLSDKVARWWLPERWAIIPEVPKTGIGKFDKKVLRGMHAEGRLQVSTVGDAARQ